MFFVFRGAVDVFVEQISSGTCRDGTAVDGRNPANQLRLGSLSPDLTGFYTSHIVQDFFHQQCHYNSILHNMHIIKSGYVWM